MITVTESLDVVTKVKEEDRVLVVVSDLENCAPCRRMHPILQSLSGELTDVQFVNIEAKDADGSFLDAFNVMAVPTMIMFVGSEEQVRVTGAVPENQLRELIEDTP